MRDFCFKKLAFKSTKTTAWHWKMENTEQTYQLYQEKQVRGQNASLVNFLQRKPILQCSLVSESTWSFFQSDNNKTELLAEMLSVQIINYTEKETHGANADYNSLWNDKSADMSLCLSAAHVWSWWAESQTGEDKRSLVRSNTALSKLCITRHTWVKRR